MFKILVFHLLKMYHVLNSWFNIVISFERCVLVSICYLNHIFIVGRHQEVLEDAPVGPVWAFVDDVLNRLSVSSVVTSCTWCSVPLVARICTPSMNSAYFIDGRPNFARFFLSRWLLIYIWEVLAFGLADISPFLFPEVNPSEFLMSFIDCLV